MPSFWSVGNGHELWVLTQKEGLLSKMAHNLKIRVEDARWSLDEASGRLGLLIPSDSLKVECAQVDGRDDFQLLSAADKAKIDDNIQKSVLHSKKFPFIRFEGQVSPDGIVKGDVSLHGRTQTLEFPWRKEGHFYIAEAELNQEDFGITPFRALMGALKVAPKVKVVAKIPVPNSFGTP